MKERPAVEELASEEREVAPEVRSNGDAPTPERGLSFFDVIQQIKQDDVDREYFLSQEMPAIITRTELNELQATTFARAIWFCNRYKVPEVAAMLEGILAARVSLKRKGRAEYRLVRGARASRTTYTERKGLE